MSKKANPYNTLPLLAKAAVADVDFEGIADGLEIADKYLSPISKYWRLGKKLVPDRMAGMFDDAQSAKDEAQQINQEIYEGIGVPSEVNMDMQNNSQTEIAIFKDALHGNLDKQRNQHIWNSLNTSIKGK